MNLREILRHYDNDWVVIESHVDLRCPNIVTGRTAEYDGGEKDESFAAQINELTIACSGVAANDVTEFNGLPVISAVTDIEKLVDLIEEKTYDYEEPETDWNYLWKLRNKDHGESGTSEYWDDRAAGFMKKSEEVDPYAEKFYELMKAEPGDTLFDMGCGSGTLAIPFAKKGHEVWAADFSQEMLNVLMKSAEGEGVADRIHPVLLDWSEDWSERDLPTCDIAFASRSMFFDNLEEALNKKESVASKRICLGAWDGPGEGLSCCYCAVGALMSRNAKPTLDYIRYPFKSKRTGLDIEAETGFIGWDKVE